MSLSDTQAIVGIAVGLVTFFGIVGGWIMVLVRRQWGKTEAQMRSRMTDMEDDHQRDLTYFDRRDRDQRAEISDLRTRLDRCEERRRDPPGFQL